MRHRSPARWLAPLALLTCVVAVAGVLGPVVREDRPGSGGAGARTESSEARTVSENGAGERRRRSYVVRAGDTLSGIADRTGVPLARLRQLNPDLDLDSLQTGQRIRLSP